MLRCTCFTGFDSSLELSRLSSLIIAVPVPGTTGSTGTGGSTSSGTSFLGVGGTGSVKLNRQLKV